MRTLLATTAAVATLIGSPGSTGATDQTSSANPALDQQVQLDRAGFSPGEIDGKAGQSKLPALNYSSALETIGEQFHSAPALLQQLNPSARFVEGEPITVPNIVKRAWTDIGPAAEASGAKPPAAPQPTVTVVVSQGASTLTVLDEKGAVIFHAPVTSGSEHDPLPLGKWAVTAVSRRPSFHYNPDLFWDANPTHAKAKIPPGPNNPVGLVWIDITREHYGIHGTPEPGKIGHTESHGCVRLTNWDALHVASFVRKGTTVLFEK